MFNRKKINRNLLPIRGFWGLGLLSILMVAAFAEFSPVKAASVTLSPTPTSRTINQGQSTTYTININRDGYAGNITLSASNLPANATAAFSPNPTTGKSSVLTVTTKTTTPTGTFQIKVSGTASGLNITPVNVTLIVKPAPGLSLSVFPATQSIIAGQSIDYRIDLTRVNYDNPVTLEAKNLPDNLTATFEPNPVYGNRSTMRIYSHLLPFTGRDYDIIVNLRELQTPRVTARLKINCGLDWAEQFGTSAGGDFAYDVAVAGDGSIYAAGNNFNPNNNSRDAWIAKYDEGGVQQWFVPILTAADDFATDVVVDSNGDIFVGGYTAGTFPGNNFRGNFDFWIAKFDSQGVQQWLKQDGTVDQDGVAGFEIIPDGAGGGKLITSTDERTRISTFTFTSAGTLTQQNSFPLVNDYVVQDADIIDLAVGPNDTVYVVGFLDFGLFSGQSGWVVKYDNLQNRNNRLWAQSVGFDSATRIVVDSSGYAFVSGTTEDSLTGTDAWVAKFNPDFTPNPGSNRIDTNPPVWTKTEASTSEDVINALAINNSGDLIIAGMTQGVLGERNGGGNSNNTRFDDAWIERRSSSDGSLKWIRQFPVADIDGFNAAAVGANNELVFAGYTVGFKTNLGFEDALLLRYADNWSFISPVISGTTPLNPASGHVGDTIHINGGNFLSVTGVRFNGVPAQYTVVSPSLIDAIVPQGAATGTVTVSGTCTCTTSQTPFTVLP